MTALGMVRSAGAGAAVFVRDVGRGMLEVSHNTLALLGLAVVAALVFALGRAEVRDATEQYVLDWLHERQIARAERDGNVLAAFSEPQAVARATAANPRELTRQQANVANWIARRYRVAPEPISRLVQEAWTVGERAGLEPTLILAIMAVESSFNPFAQSSVGAQGLMQVLTRVHDDKYERFGGTHAAFDPVTNLRVGVQVLRDCIARAGSVEAGLRYYVGAANLPDDGGYAAKVLSEQYRLNMVASGKSVPTSTPITTVIVPALPRAEREAEAEPTAPAAGAKPQQVALAR